jgi:ubiquinone/menaquinone biosynthesis C-methylase UbiE
MSQVHGLAHRWFWNIHSLTWDGWQDPCLPDGRGERTLRWVQREAPRAQRILDVGCATGRQSIALANAGFSVVGVDLSAAMCRRARDNARRLLPAHVDLTFLEGDVEHDKNLRLPAADVILLQGVLQCAASPTAMLSRVARALCADGVMLIEVRDHETGASEHRPWSRRARWFLPFKTICSQSPLVHRFSLQSLIATARRAELRVRHASNREGWLRLTARKSPSPARDTVATDARSGVQALSAAAFRPTLLRKP